MTSTRKNLETRAALLSQLICNNAAHYQAASPGEQGLLQEFSFEAYQDYKRNKRLATILG